MLEWLDPYDNWCIEFYALTAKHSNEELIESIFSKRLKGDPAIVRLFKARFAAFPCIIQVSANVVITGDEVIVTPDKRAHNPYLVASGLADVQAPTPWYGNKRLVIRFT
jgi:hypothetical protein